MGQSGREERSDPSEQVGLRQTANDTLRSLGLVFGDIGTSPIYTLSVIFLTLAPSYENVVGVLSLIVWTLIMVVGIEYAWLAMKLSERGEGGTIVLKEILVPMMKSGRKLAFISVLTIIGISLFIGDGVITPAISILSAVEGTKLIPGLGGVTQSMLILMAIVITIALFLFQKRGTEKVSNFFGPIMFIWFVMLAISGAMAIFQTPQVIEAINPLNGLGFLYHNGLTGFFVLSEVFLCATGGEALYADIGHLGRRPIKIAWYFVFVALVLSYLGQGAFVLSTSASGGSMLFGLIHTNAPMFYIPFLVIAIAATVIASQAMISGVYSIIYQAIQTRVLPWLRVHYTSEERKSQIYIGSANWLLLGAVILVILIFKESSALAAAYGLAVSGTMTITGILMTVIFWIKRKKLYAAISTLILLIDIAFLLSNFLKIPHGGYWSLIIACFPLSIIAVYILGHRRLESKIERTKMKPFIDEYMRHYEKKYKIKGTAIFLTRQLDRLPPYIAKTMFTNHIIYERNILLTLQVKDEPYGIRPINMGQQAPGLDYFVIQIGYLETIIDFEAILKDAGIQEISIFYGIEDIIPTDALARAYTILDGLTPTFVQFYNMPADKLHGVIVKVEM
jgi:KUP system potassium uptake protein